MKKDFDFDDIGKRTLTVLLMAFSKICNGE